MGVDGRRARRAPVGLAARGFWRPGKDDADGAAAGAGRPAHRGGALHGAWTLADARPWHGGGVDRHRRGHPLPLSFEGPDRRLLSGARVPLRGETRHDATGVAWGRRAVRAIVPRGRHNREGAKSRRREGRLWAHGTRLRQGYGGRAQHTGTQHRTQHTGTRHRTQHSGTRHRTQHSGTRHSGTSQLSAVSWPLPHRCHRRRAAGARLGGASAEVDLEDPGGRWMVGLCDRPRAGDHAGATGWPGDGRGLRLSHRCAAVVTWRRDPLRLGHRRRRPARDTDHRWRLRCDARVHRTAQRARLPHWSPVVEQGHRRRQPGGQPQSGAAAARRWSSTARSS